MTLDIRRPSPEVAFVYLNRPQVRNAFDDATIAELRSTFETLGADAALRAIVLGGHGPAFCAGGDLNWMLTMAGYDHAQNLADAQRLADMLWTVWSCPVPVVARIQGDCYAGGVGLVSACDIRIAATPAAFSLSEVRLGLAPATVAPYVLRALGTAESQRYFITGERFDAAAAGRMGFVHDVVAPDALDDTVAGVVSTLVANGPAAVRAAKRLLRDVAERPLDATLRADTARWIADLRGSAEGRVGVRAFLDKTAPPWRTPG